MQFDSSLFPLRPAWTEIDLARLRRNLQIIRSNLPSAVELLAVVKDDAYGHGAVDVARMALAEGASFLGVSTLEEAMVLRESGVKGRILLLGERQEAELPWCVSHDLTVCVNELHTVRLLARAAAGFAKRVPVHLKIDTGMSRYGVRWEDAIPLVEQIIAEPALELEGVMTHFAQSDETDKTFARLQQSRFDDVLAEMIRRGIDVRYRHLCNSGGFLDLPDAHHEMVRVGILMYGIFPSLVCRKLPGIEPVMSIKARIAAIRELKPGDVVGYGMRFTATTRRRIAVLPIGYGDGFPRVRNQGRALLRGKSAPIVGGIAMDALTVDITDIPDAQMWDEAVLMGRQGCEEITARDIASIKNSVTYDVLTSWRLRLRRKCVNGDAA